MIIPIHKSAEHHGDGMLDRIAREVAHFYDWVSGPPMTEQTRQDREVAEARNARFISYTGV